MINHLLCNPSPDQASPCKIDLETNSHIRVFAASGHWTSTFTLSGAQGLRLPHAAAKMIFSQKCWPTYKHGANPPFLMCKFPNADSAKHDMTFLPVCGQIKQLVMPGGKGENAPFFRVVTVANWFTLGREHDIMFRRSLLVEDFVCSNETRSAQSVAGSGDQFTGYLETHNFLTLCLTFVQLQRCVDFGDGHSSTFSVSDSYLATPDSLLSRPSLQRWTRYHIFVTIWRRLIWW